MPKITNKDRFGNTLDVEQMLKAFKIGRASCRERV